MDAIYGFARVVAGPARELCAFRFAPSSTPTLSRSTSSPPNQPVTPASANPMNDSANAAVLGVYGGTCGALYRRYQLPRNSNRTTTFPRPWSKPTDLARVSFGIASQSMRPKGAAKTAPIIPASIIQYETVFMVGLPQMR